MIRAKTLAATVGLAALVLGPLAPALGDFGATPAFAKNGNGGGSGGGNGHGNSGNKGGNSGNAGGSSNAKKSTHAAPSSTTTDPLLVPPPPNAHGKMASELKGLNAYHASETAFANASPNSQVGRIAAYRDAALETVAAGEALDEATAALAESELELQALDDSYTGRSTAEIDADIAALDPDAADFQSQLDSLAEERLAAETYETERAALEEEIAANDLAVTDAETDLADAELAEGDALTTAANGRTLSDPAIEFLREQLGL